MDYLQKLNPEQRKAVECSQGPVMIIAGAGSGKTRVLTYRIAHLLHQGVDPFNILALTFTNKAAREMRDRIEKIVGTEARSLWMGTFHSVFARILRVEAEKIGYPTNFTIYDTDDSKSLLKSIIKECGVDEQLYKPNLVFGRISSAKNNLMSPDDYYKNNELMAMDQSSGRPRIQEIYAKYAARCFKAGAMDFDDLLFKTHELLVRYPDVLNKYQHRFQYLLVDEYQDTNFAQYKIVKMIAAANRNLAVVGDDAQSIYGFRGANIQNILSFEKDYPELHTFRLEQNYRSTQNIVAAASSVIAKNVHQFEKKLWTDNAKGSKIKVLRAMSDNDEGRTVAHDIQEKRLKQQLKNADFAILYRTNAQSRAIEEGLRKLNIPYRVFGGQSFYQRKEIKDMIAYLRLVINPNDEEALKRIINYPARGIGKVSVDKLIVLADQHNTTLWEVVSNITQYPFGAGAQKIQEFGVLIQSFQALEKKQNAFDLAVHIGKHSNLYNELNSDKSVEGISRLQNLEELMNAIKEFVENDELIEGEELTNDKSLGSFLQQVSLLTDRDVQDEAGNDDTVTLMTVHMAKGLEFPQVYIVGMEENLFPSQMAMNSRQELEEERRLFYVAITRAEQELTITYALSRFRHGSLFNGEPSRFLKEIDPDTLDIVAATNLGGAYENESPQRSWQQGYQHGKPQRSTQPVNPLGGRSPQPSTLAQQQQAVRLTPEAEFVPDDSSRLAVGMQIEHQRFGIGKVVQLEGKFPDTKATIFFQGLGQKQILLKFAKIKLID
jgi:DNA helicase-2/ATP-dependent DNA helicase PcrA